MRIAPGLAITVRVKSRPLQHNLSVGSIPRSKQIAA